MQWWNHSLCLSFLMNCCLNPTKVLIVKFKVKYLPCNVGLALDASIVYVKSGLNDDRFGYRLILDV